MNLTTCRDVDLAFEQNAHLVQFPYLLGEDGRVEGKFLLEKQSSWITGQIIGVDGGRSSIA